MHANDMRANDKEVITVCTIKNQWGSPLIRIGGTAPGLRLPG